MRVSRRTAPRSSRACIRYPSNLISCNRGRRTSLRCGHTHARRKARSDKGRSRAKEQGRVPRGLRRERAITARLHQNAHLSRITPFWKVRASPQVSISHAGLNVRKGSRSALRGGYQAFDLNPRSPRERTEAPGQAASRFYLPARPTSTTLSRTSRWSRRRRRAITSIDRLRRSLSPNSRSSTSDHSHPEGIAA